VRMILIVAVAFTLAGCGFYHWRKDGADDAAFQRDSAECGGTSEQEPQRPPLQIRKRQEACHPPGHAGEEAMDVRFAGLLKRWQARLWSRGGLMRLMPYTIEVR